MKETLAADLAGVFVSLGLWLGATNLHLRIQTTAIRRLPESWRSHPELREGYRLTAELRPRDMLAERRSLAAWLGGVTVFAVCLKLVDIPLWMSLAAAVAWAGYFACSRGRAAARRSYQGGPSSACRSLSATAGSPRASWLRCFSERSASSSSRSSSATCSRPSPIDAL